MYITPGRSPHSILPIGSGSSDKLLLIGGGSHVPGLSTSSKKRFQKLAEYAADKFKINSIEYMWSARDYLGYDRMPLVVKLYSWSKHLYTATGFMKWGLTNATVAGMILCDTILEQPHPWAEIFDSNRLRPITDIPRSTVK